MSPFGGRKISSIDAESLGPRLLTREASNEFHPEYSPDGKRIAFITDRAIPGSRGPLGLNLRIMAADGANPRPLTTCFRQLVSADWSPRGGRLLLRGLDSGFQTNHYSLDLARRTLRVDLEREALRGIQEPTEGRGPEAGHAAQAQGRAPASPAMPRSGRPSAGPFPLSEPARLADRRPAARASAGARDGAAAGAPTTPPR